MTSHLRAETHASGWPTDISRRVRVSHKDGSFDVHTHHSVEAQVHDLEYGTPDDRPTAAIRRFSNRTSEAETFLLGRMSRILGEI
jgi:hypothetical protein